MMVIVTWLGTIINVVACSKNVTRYEKRAKTKTANQDFLLLQVLIETSSEKKAFIKEKEKSGN
jgi:hypothetical protein